MRRAVAHGLARVTDDLLGDGDPAEVELDPEAPVCSQGLLDRRLRLLLRLRVPVDAARDDDGHAILERERLDEVLLAEVEVDGAFVHRRVRTVALDEPEQRSGRAVDDGERLRVARAQRHAGGGVVAALPDVSGRRVLQLRELGRTTQRLRAERRRVLLLERRLERGREHVRVEDARVRVVEDRGLDAAREQRVRLAREELVERVVARDEDGQPSLASPCAPPLLAQRCDRAGEADGDRAVEEPDVDPELERVRRGHAEELALDETTLDLAALLRRVAGPVRSEAARSRDCRGAPPRSGG